jgi:hypothetical protein
VGGSLVILAVMIAVMIRLDRIYRQRIQRRRQAWKAEGGIGTCPGDDTGSNTGGYLSGNFG